MKYYLYIFDKPTNTDLTDNVYSGFAIIDIDDNHALFKRLDNENI